MSYLNGFRSNKWASPSRLISLATIAIWLLVVILLAQLTWWLVAPAAPTGGTSAPSLPSSYNAAEDTAVDIAALQRLNLFGESSQTSSTTRRDAPKTSLNIRLVGVSASSNPLRSAAIIEQAGQQQTYIVGDKLGRSGVTVEEIYADRVLLDNNGRIETLQLEDIGEDRPALSLIVEQPQQEATETVPEQDLEQAVEEINADPQSLTDYVSISPAMDNGQLIGYRLEAGQKPELFRQAGLQNGDLAIAINGYDLTDMQQAMQLSNELTTLTRADIEIVRDGQPMQLTIELANEQDN
ncbi:type II secretion system protein GspC [Idiomarina aquatica]|uniref:type II secretion system protein GspC n=1 Tax=Idiomarina aquatica TaxID=1327752 RepID=UPI001F5407E9|nr:type II secretion system protein GspC [Idiomarina aquatica]